MDSEGVGGRSGEGTTKGATRGVLAAGGPGGIIGSMQGELDAFRKQVLGEFQDLHQKIAEGSERTSDTRRQLGETEGRFASRTDTVWEETRQQWETVSKRLHEESKVHIYIY